MKKKISVLLVCGAGASSSFMAAKMRLAAKKKKIDLNVSARAESEIVNFIGDVDAIMIGPHLSVYYEEVKERYSEECAVILMKKEYYSTLNGDEAIEHLLQEIGNK
ncbi:MAG: PTS sugar transporter subunit IIB [Erysipelotrichaceae bacterium]|nr:PTS sugar transporter subunit IIB [Erysipelotrichaceae bacterium]